MVHTNMFVLFFVCLLSLPQDVFADPPNLTHETTSPEIKRVSDVIQKMIRKKSIAGAVALVSWKGRIIHNSTHGMRDIKEKQPLYEDSLFRIYSMTKPITSVAVMILQEQKKLNLDDPIEQYIPEFKDIDVHNNGKPVSPTRSITIRDLLRHTSGLTYGFFSNTAVDKMYLKKHPLYSKNNKQMTQTLTSYPLLFDPGKRWHYSVATDVLGDLIERVSGQTLEQFFSKHILTPLNMNDTFFSVPNEKISRFSSSYGPKQKIKESYHSSYYQYKKRIQSGGGGLVSTASDYMQFCTMLLNRGTLSNVQILTPESIAQMTKNQLPKGIFAYGYFGFGLGFQVQLHDWKDKGHVGEYGWNGAASTHFWISPTDELIVILLSQCQPYSDALKKKIKPLIYAHIQE